VYGQVYDVLTKLLVEQELLTLPEHMSAPPVFSRVPVSLSFMCRFCRSLFVLLCVFCSSSIYGFWLPLWYLQALLIWVYIYPNVCNEKSRQCQSTFHQPQNEQLYAITTPKNIRHQQVNW